MADCIVGLFFITLGAGILYCHFCGGAPEIVGRNEAVRRLLQKSEGWDA